MIELHRLSAGREPLHVNPDLILAIEGTPDTHVRFTTGATILVAESPREVVEAVRAWRISIAGRPLALHG